MGNQRPKVLLLCTSNACRSQMAEGWARYMHTGVFDAYSAGVVPHGVDPRAITVMAEAGIDMTAHTSKSVDDLLDVPFDYVVTVCDSAAEVCPVFPGTVRVVHHGFQDPPRRAANAATEEEALQHYRRVRDEIRDFVTTLPDILYQQTGAT